MGLDTVELVMAVEEEFGIEIPDDLAEPIVTVGDLYDCVMAKLKDTESPWSHRDPDVIWQRLRGIVVHQTGVDVSRVVKFAAIVDDLHLD